MIHPSRSRRPAWIALTLGVLVAPLAVLAAAAPGQAASSDSCEGGGFRLVNLGTGATLAAGGGEWTIRASSLGAAGGRFGVRGRYISSNVRLRDFAVYDYAFTGAATPEDITGGRRTPVYASKVPQH